MHLIGINGFKRSGKGTVAGIVFEQHDGIVYETGFADKMKFLAARALGFDRPPRELIDLMNEAKETWDIYVNTPEGTNWHDLSGREYLQHFGSEARAVLGNNVWVDLVLPRPDRRQDQVDRALHNQEALEALYPDVDCLVISDLRFENEAQRVLDLGGVVWEVIRPGSFSDGHVSEQPLPEELVTRQIDNGGTIDDLAAEVATALSVTL